MTVKLFLVCSLYICCNICIVLAETDSQPSLDLSKRRPGWGKRTASNTLVEVRYDGDDDEFGSLSDDEDPSAETRTEWENDSDSYDKDLIKRTPGWGKRAPGWGKRTAYSELFKRRPGWGKRSGTSRSIIGFEELSKRRPGWGKRSFLETEKRTPGWGKRTPGWGKRSGTSDIGACFELNKEVSYYVSHALQVRSRYTRIHTCYGSRLVFCDSCFYLFDQKF